MMRLDEVILGPIVEKDKDTLFRWINDPEVVTFNSAFKPVSEYSHLNWMLKTSSDPCTVAFAIRRYSDERLLGIVQLTGIELVHHSAKLSIRIGEPSNRGRGIGSKALFLILQYGFQHLNLNRIALEVFSDNTLAIAAYEKVGFQKEGVLRQACYVNGGWKDVICMAFLRKNYVHV